MSFSPHELASRIREAALGNGYVACGITHAGRFVEYENRLQDRMNRFPEAVNLYAPLRDRVDPLRDAPWVRSIVVCVRYYGKYDLPAEPLGHIGRTYLADRRVSACPDSAMPKRMNEVLARLGVRARRGGCPDRAAAARAGVVSLGRNGFAYAGRWGSWVNIETWRIDAELPPDRAADSCPCPPDCRACVHACPTGALVEPWLLCPTRCIAYLTFSAPEPLDPVLASKMGGWIYGCDVCQEVCPLNQGAWQGGQSPDWLLPVAKYLSPQALANMSEKTYREIVHPLFSYIPPDNLSRWQRNARRALLQCS
ncbi:MAG: epoxyqueuosine reductase [Kiritimatiellia bacterium]